MIIIMLHSITYLQEVKFLLVLLLLILGCQVAAIFFYKFYKLKDENVKLNRILLSYGFLISMGMLCMYLLTYVTLFVIDPVLSEILRKIAYISVMLALVAFWFYIGSKEFKDLISSKLARLFSVLSIVPIFAILLLETNAQEFIYVFVLILIEGVFMVIFQVKLIKNTFGNVRNRFILIFAGALIILVSMLLGGNTALNIFSVSEEVFHLIFFLSVSSMFIGLVFIYVALFNFPPILEFKWKESLLKLIVFNQENYSVLFTREFSIEDAHAGELVKESSDQLFTGGISGIDSIISSVTNTEGAKIKKIKHGSSFILLEYSSKYENIPITFALVVKEDLNSIRYFLFSLKEQFESFYKEILLNYAEIEGNVQQLFGSFDIILNNLMEVV